MSCHVHDTAECSCVVVVKRLFARYPSQASVSHVLACIVLQIKLTELVQKIYEHDDAWPFREPVDASLVPDYLTRIKEPVGKCGASQSQVQTLSARCCARFLSPASCWVCECACTTAAAERCVPHSVHKLLRQSIRRQQLRTAHGCNVCAY